MIKIVIPIPPRTKKNSSQIMVNHKTNTPFIMPSKFYTQFKKDCGVFIRCKGLNINYPVNIKCLYYMPTLRDIDLTNLEEATDDILVLYRVLSDDNCRIVVSHDGSRVYYDKDNPRTEIYIEETVSSFPDKVEKTPKRKKT